MKPETRNTESRAYSALKEMFQGMRPLIFVCTPEEGRVRQLLKDIAEKLFTESLPVWTWSLTAGLQHPDDSTVEKLSPQAVLNFIAAHPARGIFHLKDFNPFMCEDAGIRRQLRDIYETCMDSGKFIVFTSPLRMIPEELSRQIALVELHTPDFEELLQFLITEAETLKSQGFKVDSGEPVLNAMARALQGLTLDESRHALRRAVSTHGSLDENSMRSLAEEKKLIVNRTGLIQYIADATQLEHVGGLEYLKSWLLERRKLFLERDSLSAEIVPKGLLVMGVSGCGKSLSVKAIASCFELPLYRIEMSEVFSGRHGNPDAAFVEACRTVESVAPAVVWFDEIEMGLTGQAGDSGTNLGRIFAFFLTWMQEKTRGLFVAATANRIDLLPAEMIRKGRFDEVFFIDLPTEDERMEVFQIHLSKRGVDPKNLELHRLKRITQGWTGAEIEQCVVSAITQVRLQDKELRFEDLHQAALNIIPLSKTMREQVDHIRSWAYDRAVRASPREAKV
ncbi:MAG: AAA family ATPase [Acidobacteriota bacterium]|nr:AAA family ATPase [Acidobacteriota bacterium]